MLTVGGPGPARPGLDGTFDSLPVDAFVERDIAALALHHDQAAGFGTFETKERAARQGRNPGTGEPIAIAASRAPAFKAGKALRDAVRG